MTKPNIILEKSYAFSLSNIELYKKQYDNVKYRDLLRQLLRCGTSIGAITKTMKGSNNV